MTKPDSNIKVIMIIISFMIGVKSRLKIVIYNNTIFNCGSNLPKVIERRNYGRQNCVDSGFN